MPLCVRQFFVDENSGMKTNIHIRAMQKEDWAQVSVIYESGIQTGLATFETKVPTWEYWNNRHLKFGRLVAVWEEQVVGWFALTPVSKRAVYRGVAEVSIYIAQNQRGKGIGQQLFQAGILASEANGIWTLQSSIFRENLVSHKLHERMGFRKIGYRERVAQLHGVWKDNVLFERRSSLF